MSTKYEIWNSFDELDSSNNFYEGRWSQTDLNQSSLRTHLIKKQRFFLSELSGKNGALLDLGCGGGWSFFAQHEPAIGLDISYTSLQNAQQIYDATLQGSIIKLPFADASFDYVVSLDVLGHIALKNKEILLSEIYRVLKPDGKTMHYIEALSNDPLCKWCRQYPDLYIQHFIIPEGHIGLETPTTIFDRFRKIGFIPVREITAYKALIYIERLVQYFDNEYKKNSRAIAFLVNICKLLKRIPIMKLFSDLIITLCFEILDPLLPKNWAGGVLVSYTKEK